MRQLARFTVLVLFAAPAGWGQTSDVRTPGAPWLSNLDTPRATAMGGAFSAVATGNDALFVNPAGIAQSRHYHLEADGVLDTRFPLQGLLLSVTDTTTGPIGSGGYFAHWGSGRDDGRAQGWLAGLAYSYNAGSVYFGGVSKYLHFNIPLSADSADGVVHQIAQDFGVLAKRGDFSWGLVVQNLSLSGHPLFPVTGAVGVQFGSDQSSHLALDYKADLSDTSNIKHKLAAGYELLIDTFALRAGGTYDATNSLWWLSAGVGLLTERGGVQFAYRRRLSAGVDNVFEAGVTLYLE